MRIVLVNWARIWDGAAHGGGVNGYCQALALELTARGHEVISICSGATYEPEPGTRRLGPITVHRHPDWLGIKVFEIINSPILAPALPQFRDAAGEISSPALESEFGQLIRTLEPDVVHFHNIEGLSAGCVATVRRNTPRATIFYSIHNYHTICPQVYLMQGHRRPCRTYDNGHNCTNCIPTIDPAEEKHRLALGGEPPTFTWNQREPESTAASPLGEGKPVAQLLRRVRRAASAVRPGQITLSSGDIPLNILDPYPAGDGDSRGQILELQQSRRPHPWSPAGQSIPAWRPLLNTVEPELRSDKAPNAYALRRSAMIDMLNTCDGVIAVSGYVHQKYLSLGVMPKVLRTMHIGSRMPEVIARRPEALAPPPPFDPANPRPIRMAFVGYNNWYKGLPMLADSLEMLTPEILRQIHLCVYALNGEEMERQLRRLEMRLAGLTLRHGYSIEDLPWLLSGVDVGLVTSVWWDNGPQTVMEFQSCGIPLIAAELGGIPDFVREGENGLLFCGNSRWDLARRIAEVVKNPSQLDRMRANVHPPRTISAHAEELLQLYTDPLS